MFIACSYFKEHLYSPTQPIKAQNQQRGKIILNSLNSAPSVNRPSLYLILLILYNCVPSTVLSQPQPFVYTPRHSAASVVVDNVLYIIGGTSSTQFQQPLSDVISIPLTGSFSTDSIPWVSLAPGPKVYDARVAFSPDKSKLVLLGTSDVLMAAVYDITANTWNSVPSTAGVFVQSSRVSMSLALDTSTGVFVVYGGGFSAGGVTNELDFLYSTSSQYTDLVWASIPSAKQIQPLFQPISVYLPQMQSTLIMGGCSSYSPVKGASDSEQLFTTGYLIRTMFSENRTPTASISTIGLKGLDPTNPPGNIPAPRQSPCYLVLSSGDVFMYGGSVASGSLNDAWILRTNNFTWTPVMIKNGPALGRAGATCQLVSSNQVMLVGGKTFADPQTLLIKLDSLTWSSSFVAVKVDGGNGGGLSKPVIIGIAAGGGALLFSIIVTVLIWKCCRNSKSERRKPFTRPSHSRDHLVGGSDNGDDPASSTRRLLASSEVSLSNISSKDSKTLPLIITPLSISTDSSSTVVGSMSSTSSLPRLPKSKIDVDFPESERLPRTTADIQQSHYTKTTAHTREYDKRQGEKIKQTPYQNNLTHTLTQHQYLRQMQNNDKPELVTSLFQLKDIEMGEESLIPLQSMGTDTDMMLISSHLESTPTIPPTMPPALPMGSKPTIPQSFRASIQHPMVPIRQSELSRHMMNANTAMMPGATNIGTVTLTPIGNIGYPIELSKARDSIGIVAGSSIILGNQDNRPKPKPRPTKLEYVPGEQGLFTAPMKTAPIITLPSAPVGTGNFNIISVIGAEEPKVVVALPGKEEYISESFETETLVDNRPSRKTNNN
ncbi:hypothetical protein BGZ76_010299 [Entomortierella beljakovae]|nr:hypothetical protein BGZ76_010299 [Entomortierella beljakovae]